MGRRGHRFFLGGGGWGLVVRCRGFIEEKSPDFRFPKVGISAIALSKNATRFYFVTGKQRNAIYDTFGLLNSLIT